MIKVAHIITRMILGGAQENTLYTVQGLSRLPNYDVTLITGPAIGPEGELVEEARKSGVKLILVDELRRELSAYYDPVSFVKLVSVLRRLKPDIVHTHSSKAGILGRWAARLLRVPCIVHTIHGLPFHPYERPLLNWLYIRLERSAAKCSDAIICVANAMAEQSLAAGVGRPDLYTTIYSGMDIDEFLRAGAKRAATRQRLGFADSDIVIGKIARIAPLKGYEYVVQIAPELLRRFPRARFLFVGDGTLRPEIERAVADAGMSDRIVFTGLVPATEIPELVSAMDVLVHASLREGLARVLPQALASGKPVVSFDIDGAKEVVLDGVTGYLVEPESAEGLLDALTKVLSLPDLGRSLGEEGRRRFANAFRKEEMVRRIAALYEQLLRRCPRREQHAVRSKE